MVLPVGDPGMHGGVLPLSQPLLRDTLTVSDQIIRVVILCQNKHLPQWQQLQMLHSILHEIVCRYRKYAANEVLDEQCVRTNEAGFEHVAGTATEAGVFTHCATKRQGSLISDMLHPLNLVMTLQVCLRRSNPRGSNIPLSFASIQLLQRSFVVTLKQKSLYSWLLKVCLGCVATPGKEWNALLM